MAKKSAKTPANTQRAVHQPVAGDKAARAGTPEQTTGSAKGAAATRASASVAPATGLGKADVKRIQEMLKSKTADEVTLGLSLLESLGATRADYEAVFKEAVIKSILGGWVAESWGAVAKALVPHGAVSDLFQTLAAEKYVKRPQRLSDFNGLASAGAAAARPAFLAAWGQASESAKSFIDLVDIPAGSFAMGSPKDEPKRCSDETQVEVHITKPFRMARTVVTKGQWRAVMGTEPWQRRYYKEHGVAFEEGQNAEYCGDHFPAEYVSWNEAELFCQTLTALERETGRLTSSQSYRLPTEAEWEYACRAGTTTAYSFGDDPFEVVRGVVREFLGEHGWYYNNSEELHEVGQKKPNPWGLLDMHGNVWEWCADWYTDILSGGNDPGGPAVGYNRLSRGGFWGYDASYCRSAYRGNYFPGNHSYARGFRVIVEC
jgi:formylglycine-generating enzyme